MVVVGHLLDEDLRSHGGRDGALLGIEDARPVIAFPGFDEVAGELVEHGGRAGQLAFHDQLAVEIPQRQLRGDVFDRHPAECEQIVQLLAD